MFYFSKAKLSTMQELEYRSNIIMTTLGAYGFMALQLVFITTLFSKVDSIGNWGKYHMIMLFGVGQLVIYFQWWFSSGFEFNNVRNAIMGGKLDQILTKPIKPIVSILATDFSIAETIPATLFVFCIIGFAWSHLQLTFSPATVLAVFLAAISSVTYSLMKLCVGLACFWIGDVNELAKVIYRSFEFNSYPLEIYPRGLKVVFTTILPIALLSYVPAYTLIFGINLTLVGMHLVALFIFCTLSYVLWTQGLKKYSSISS